MRNREMGELINEYMAATKLSRRTAQLHRQKKNPRWCEWLESRGAERIVAAKDRDKARIAVEVAEELADETETVEYASEAHRIEAAALVAVQKLERLKSEAIEHGTQLDAIASLTRSHEIAFSHWEKSRKLRQQEEISSGVLIHRDQLKGFFAALRGVKSILEKMPADLGPKANPTDAGYGISAIADFVQHRLGKQIAEAMSVLKGVHKE